jgi:hypothetical protein
MKRILLSAAVAASLLLAGCGPDCDAFCRKLVSCGMSLDPAQCRTGCGNVGGDHVAYVNCVIDKSCVQIDADVCRLP